MGSQLTVRGIIGWLDISSMVKGGTPQMDQEKIGKFIASCRKETGLTQAALADKLNITDRAVSKWETGRSLPDVSIMLELCNLLNISVNELLTGEHISMDDYKEKAEANLLEMTKKIERIDRNWLRLERIMGCTVIPFDVLICISGAYEIESGNTLIGALMLVGALLVVLITCFLGLKIEHDAGYYECPNCGERYVPTMKAVVMAPHIGRNRKMKCPYCGEKGYHKKVVSKNRGVS